METCRQANLDQWLTDDSATYRHTAGHFVRWARANKLTTVHVPLSAGTAPPSHSMTSAGGTSHAGSCTTTPSSPKTASQGSFSSSTHKGHRRSTD
ncbi:hypothetical protein ID871_34200 [Streptomyces pratensis]|nr:hypothetical protein [Streptomyces pratensis]